MATIGFDSLYYATITEATASSTGVEIGDETYGTPAVLAKGISANLSINSADATLYADDGAVEKVNDFKDGSITLGIADIGSSVAAALTGSTVDGNGVLVSTSEDAAPYVAIGFRAKKSNDKYRYFWLYKVKFAPVSTSLQTKGDSVSFQTPSIQGTILRRNKKDYNNKHPWKSEVTDGETGVTSSVISGWFSTVYEPSAST